VGHSQQVVVVEKVVVVVVVKSDYLERERKWKM
jgi:hypothetical protein